MKNKILLYFIPFLFGCNSSNSQTDSSLELPKQIKIIDKTVSYFSDTLIISDSMFIKEYCDEIKKMRVEKNANLKANKGFFEVRLYYKNKSEDEYAIIETTYDGIIIMHSYGSDAGILYKNDKLHSMLFWKNKGNE